MSPDRLIDVLERTPEQFDFFQAVWLLEQHSLSPGDGEGEADHADDGLGRIRFRAAASLSFPQSEVSALQRSADLRTDISVPFLGLTGPCGALPEHYTAFLLERGHPRHGDHAMREFFDLFNDRAVRMYYLAWRKHRICEEYQRTAAAADGRVDRFSEALYSIVGLGTAALRRLLPFDPELVLYFGGLFADTCRTASGLEQVLSRILHLPVRLEQFCGRWLNLPLQVQSALPSSAVPLGCNLLLGENVVAGQRVWDEQSQFRVQLGPVRAKDFRSLLPGGRLLEFIADFIRFYAGPELDFEVQILLETSEIPWPVLGSPRPGEENNSGWMPLRCGQSIWLGAQLKTGIVDDPVFRFSGLPAC